MIILCCHSYAARCPFLPVCVGGQSGAKRVETTGGAGGNLKSENYEFYIFLGFCVWVVYVFAKVTESVTLALETKKGIPGYPKATIRQSF